VEFGADDPNEAQQLAAGLVDHMKQVRGAPNARLYSKSEARAVWQIRDGRGHAPLRSLPARRRNGKAGMTAAVAPEKLGGYLRDIRNLMNEYHYRGAFYGHFGHGCVHNAGKLRS